MGFDQYHEPPEELPAATRTFARLCASLTEEAEAIGWYEQRLAVEADPDARAIMLDAQGEEFKHFAMDLEFLLRRTPKWREIARGVLFQPGDIVEHGESAEAAAGDEGGESDSSLVGGGRLGHARHRRPQGARVVNHLLRSVAPISERAWAMLDDEAKEHLVPALGARKLVDFGGPYGFEYSATNLGRVRRLDSSPCDGVEARQRRVLPLVELRSDFTVSRSELTDFERGAVDADLDDLDDAVRRIALAENAAVFNGFEAAGIDGIVGASPHEPIPLGDKTGSYPSQVAKAVELMLPRGHRRTVRARARARRVHATSSRRPSTAAIPCSTTCATSSAVRSCGRRASTAPWPSACAAATSCSSRARISRSDTSAPTRRASTCTRRRASASAWRRRRRPWRCPEAGVVPAVRRSVGSGARPSLRRPARR